MAVPAREYSVGGVDHQGGAGQPREWICQTEMERKVRRRSLWKDPVYYRGKLSFIYNIHINALYSKGRYREKIAKKNLTVLESKIKIA